MIHARSDYKTREKSVFRGVGDRGDQTSSSYYNSSPLQLQIERESKRESEDEIRLFPKIRVKFIVFLTFGLNWIRPFSLGRTLRRVKYVGVFFWPLLFFSLSFFLSTKINTDSLGLSSYLLEIARAEMCVSDDFFRYNLAERNDKKKEEKRRDTPLTREKVLMNPSRSSSRTNKMPTSVLLAHRKVISSRVLNFEFTTYFETRSIGLEPWLGNE